MDVDAIQTAGLDRATVLALSKRGNAQALLRLVSHLACLFAASGLVWLALGSVLVVPAIVLEGILLVFLFCPLHETIHRTAFASHWLNDGVAFLAGALLLLPPEYFRQFHFAHHRFTQDQTSDPELTTPKPATLWAYLWHVTGLPYWWSGLRTTLKHAVTGRVEEAFVAPAKARRVIREARLLWACYLALAAVSILIGSEAVLLIWILPALAGQPFLRLYLLAEHMGCPETADMLANSRTTSTNALLRWLAWNMPYHGEHHAYPSVPFHALPALNGLIGDHVQTRASGYIAVHRALLGGLRA
ncbi:MAG: fatty acid desaturase [Proteobacteria bacterium]|nr:fatty acid desaturase [Pseudomonadota bacterium]MBI3497799.1 fatty acid desaturase [Pseudomonadota bacterium]